MDLSTNTDIIFVRQDGISLSELAAGLEPGLYQAPRLEIPETLWEGLNRTEPRSIIETVRGWGRSLHLDEIVYGNKSILYDGPGDFQLMDREGILAINGFDERMLVGWHLNSNISKRMELRYGRISILVIMYTRITAITPGRSQLLMHTTTCKTTLSALLRA